MKREMNIRHSIIAGSWYPGNPSVLKKEINGYLDRADVSDVKGNLIGVVSPHAGYMYSGPVAAYAYKNLKDRGINTVIMVGPSHRAFFNGVAAYGSGAWETPLGQVEIDKELAYAIIEGDKTFVSDLPQAHAQEHSLEIQLPFLQTVLNSSFKIVPLMLFDHSLASCQKLAQAVFKAAQGRKDLLLLASSDLSHYHAQAEANKLDGLVASSIEKYDYRKLVDDLSTEKCEACGGGPIVTVMIASQLLGADKGVVYDYRTSGDVTGDKDQVVGYLAAGFYKTKD